jgi:hypothetical protein
VWLAFRFEVGAQQAELPLLLPVLVRFGSLRARLDSRQRPEE